MFDTHVLGGTLRLHGLGFAGRRVRRGRVEIDYLRTGARNCRRLFLILKVHALREPLTAFINRSATPCSALASAV